MRRRYKDRIKALDELHQAGIKTYAMIAPILPGAEGLVELLKGKVDYILIDRMNYNHADGIYRKYGMADKLTDDYFYRTANELRPPVPNMVLNVMLFSNKYQIMRTQFSTFRLSSGAPVSSRQRCRSATSRTLMLPLPVLAKTSPGLPALF